MSNCPSCSNPVPAGAAFCDNCGASLAGTVAPQPVAVPIQAGGGSTCAQCGHPVVAGEAFCDNCGAAISAAPAPVQQQMPQAPVPQYTPPPVPVVPSGGMVTCSSCGASNTPGNAFCDNCGNQLSGQAAVPPGPVVSPPSPGMRPLLVAVNGAQFDLSGKTEAIIGREDPVSGVFPEVDLTPHGGDAGGVSRRHAKLAFNGYQWTVEDLNSTNFTYVNNQKLNPGVPQPLNNGDQVRLGKVVLTFQTM